MTWTVVVTIGVLASLLTFVAFFMKDAVRLRQIALASNIVYMVWSWNTHAYPTFVLHLALFPVNARRLIELRRERRLIDEAIAANDVSAEWLVDFMDRRRVAAGTVLFRRGDPADAIYFLAGGALWIDELGIDLRPGALLGEIGIFAPDGRRTQTVHALEASLLYTLRRDQALALYRRDPAFGIYLIRLITRRLVEDLARERGAAPGAATSGGAADASA